MSVPSLAASAPAGTPGAAFVRLVDAHVVGQVAQNRPRRRGRRWHGRAAPIWGPAPAEGGRHGGVAGLALQVEQSPVAFVRVLGAARAGRPDASW
jgi:hypothetical protein